MKFKMEKRQKPKISTASLPDIIFMLLFFFMVTTVIKTNSSYDIKLPKVQNAEEVKEKTEINLVLSNEVEPKLYVNNKIVSFDNKEDILRQKIQGLTDYEKSRTVVSLFIEKSIEMKYVYELKLVLRKLGLQNINYMSIS